jgi:hypothetical protein
VSQEDKPAVVESVTLKRPGSRPKLTQVAWGSFAAAAVLTSLLIVAGYWQISVLRGRIEARKAQLSDLETRYNVLDTSYRELETSFNQLKYISSALPAEPAKEAATPKAAPAAPVKEAVPPKAAARPNLEVYIQIASEKQRPKAETTAALLRAAGYPVPGVGGIVLLGGGQASPATQLRYFQRSDEQGSDLAGIAKVLQQAGIDVHPHYIALSTAVRSGHFELWLGSVE